MPALNQNKQCLDINQFRTAFFIFIIFLHTLCQYLCFTFVQPKCLAVQYSDPKVACKTPFSCRLFDILVNSGPKPIAIITYKTAFSVSSNNHMRCTHEQIQYTMTETVHVAMIRRLQNVQSAQWGTNSLPPYVNTQTRYG